MVKRSIDRKLRLRRQKWENWNWDSGYESQGSRWCSKGDKEFANNGKQKGSVREETSVVSGTTKISVQNRHQKPLHPLSHQHKGRTASRKKNLRGQSPSGKFARQPCKDFLKGTRTKLRCDCKQPLKCQFYKSESGCKFGNKCSFPHKKVEVQPHKKPKKGGDKNTVAMVKDARQLGCAFQDTEPPESWSNWRKSTKVLGSIRRVRFTIATQRQVGRKNQVKFLISAVPTLWYLRTSLRRRLKDKSDVPRKRVEIGQEYLKAQRKRQSYHLLLTYQRMVSTSAIRNKTGGKNLL